jgi:hypothetical protein
MIKLSITIILLSVKMEHSLKVMRKKWNISAQIWNSRINSKYNGEETKYKSFAVKDIVKERYLKYYKLD